MICQAKKIDYPKCKREATHKRADDLYLCSRCARKLAGWQKQLWAKGVGEVPEGLRIARIK